MLLSERTGPSAVNRAGSVQSGQATRLRSPSSDTRACGSCSQPAVSTSLRSGFVAGGSSGAGPSLLDAGALSASSSASATRGRRRSAPAQPDLGVPTIGQRGDVDAPGSPRVNPASTPWRGSTRRGGRGIDGRQGARRYHHQHPRVEVGALDDAAVMSTTVSSRGRTSAMAQASCLRVVLSMRGVGAVSAGGTTRPRRPAAPSSSDLLCQTKRCSDRACRASTDVVGPPAAGRLTPLGSLRAVEAGGTSIDRTRPMRRRTSPGSSASISTTAWCRRWPTASSHASRSSTASHGDRTSGWCSSPDQPASARPHSPCRSRCVDGRPVAWVTVDEHNATPLSLLRSIAVAVHALEPLPPAVVDALLGGEQTWYTSALPFARLCAS